MGLLDFVMKKVRGKAEKKEERIEKKPEDNVLYGPVAGPGPIAVQIEKKEKQTELGRVEKELEIIRQKLEEHHNKSMEKHDDTHRKLGDSFNMLESILAGVRELKGPERAAVLAKADKAMEKGKTELIREETVAALKEKNGLSFSDIKHYIEAKYSNVGFEVQDMLLSRVLKEMMAAGRVHKKMPAKLYFLTE
jgi:hypothetical protein